MKDKAKIIFWNVDTQKDFMNPDGALYVEGAETIKPNLKKLTDLAEECNIMVVNTCDSHYSDDEELSKEPDFINTFPPHCMVGTNGRIFIDETRPESGRYDVLYYGEEEPIVNLNNNNIVIYKNKFDVFQGNPHTSKFLQLINPDIIVVYGVATNVCVDCAVMGLAKTGREVIVITDAIKELPNIPVDDIYNKWKENGVIRVSTQELIDKLGSY